ncbi:hypothetical protein MUO14_14270 [Halobacillus shinanisalinarum]|uniref:Uncharacterized protein n=1 Tax=Halobacillus shinanisalinarum TaxID=2932258 RepID=A0ABY4GU81_9BACI|nr:hypothetical protein [Halobacillus shinanisalinarum]UOQ91708.1 hypothetical protein MUO14_14270 [Halobacillus shinanisalinarum]
MFYSVTLQKILIFTGWGIIIGAIVGFSAVLGFDLDGSVFILSMFLSIIGVFLAAMYAELYHIREAVNKQRKETTRGN